jgi:hypothetical protein
MGFPPVLPGFALRKDLLAVDFREALPSFIMKAKCWIVFAASSLCPMFGGASVASACSRTFQTTAEMTYPTAGGTVAPDFRAFFFVRQTYTNPPTPGAMPSDLTQPDQSRLAATTLGFRRDGRYETPSDLMDHYSVWATFTPIRAVPAGAPYSLFGRSFTVQGDASVSRRRRSLPLHRPLLLPSVRPNVQPVVAPVAAQRPLMNVSATFLFWLLPQRLLQRMGERLLGSCFSMLAARRISSLRLSPQATGAT